MARYIDADVLIKDLKRQYMFLFGTDELPNGIQGVIKNFPTADVVPVVYGEWIDTNPKESLDPRVTCSICGNTEVLHIGNFCPNCGADMRGGTDGI